MPAPSTAQLTRQVDVPDEIGEAVWVERRAIPVLVFFGVPIGFLLVLAAGVDSLALRAVAVCIALGLVVPLVRARRRSLIETYTLTDRHVLVEQAHGGRVAIRVDALERVTLRGDSVCIESDDGTVTLGYVRRQRAFVAALERVAPRIAVSREMGAFCPT